MREIYLDNAATTRVSESAARIAFNIMRENYGNPSSLHSKGFAAEQALRLARTQLADALACSAEEIYFCSGGTEANNLAIFGTANAHMRRGKTIITTAVEHSSILEPVHQLESQGFKSKIIAPAPDGSANINAILDAVDDDTILVSCMAVNSETGAINQIDDLGRSLKRKKPDILFHCDAVQAFGKLPLSLRSSPIDLLTISSHKIHAPKGSGALFARRGVRIKPLLFGGGQENRLRAGTESLPLICAFGHMAQEMCEKREENFAYVKELAEHFLEKAKFISNICINSPDNGTPYIKNISAPGWRSETLLHALEEDGIYVSSGSACSKGKPSHVLTAMGLAPQKIDSALRLSLCCENTAEDIDIFFERLAFAMARLAKK